MNKLRLLILLTFLASYAGMGESFAAPTSYCTVASEIALKGIDLFADQPEKGLNALKSAYDRCPGDIGIGYNLGLGYYKSGNLKEARQIWERVHKSDTEDYKTLVNLAWLRFEMGDDDKAHILSFNGLLKFPKSEALAHTKLYSLFRMGRYLEAYDWLNRPTFETPRLVEWRSQAADYVTATLWLQFHRGERLSALRQVVNFLIKEYPQEVAFTRAKDQLVMAAIDTDAEIPYPIPLPHEVWAKTGDIDNRRDMLDGRLKTLPELQKWRKREDAYAVFAGITGYKRLTARYFGARDAKNMHTLLTKRGEFMADRQHVKIRLDQAATRQNIIQDLEWLITKGRTNPNAKLFFYFAGLGVSINDGEDALLVPFDAVKGHINPDTAVSVSRLRAAIDDLQNREIVVIIDACFKDRDVCGSGDSNSNGSQISHDLFNGNGSWIISAMSGPNKVHGSGRQGAFTYYLLKGLFGSADGARARSALGKKDGWVSMSEMFHYANKMQKQNMTKTDAMFFAGPDTTRLTRVGGEK
ncbi:MAG: caspase family protein [Magnetococcales bacterium]|nr:caspase family protein [Magnetococcales bacterium]